MTKLKFNLYQLLCFYGHLNELPDKYKDKLVVSFKKLIEEIRDYILNIGNEDYNESSKNKDKIALLLDEITKILFD